VPAAVLGIVPALFESVVEVPQDVELHAGLARQLVASHAPVDFRHLAGAEAIYVYPLFLGLVGGLGGEGGLTAPSQPE